MIHSVNFGKRENVCGKCKRENCMGKYVFDISKRHIFSSSIFASRNSFKMLEKFSSSLRTRLEGFLWIFGIYLLFPW